MPSITQLEYLVAVSRNLHFGKAARECHVSQPSLSAQIHKLEQELGVVVFDRSRQPVKVTKAGERVVEQARQVLREHARLIQIGLDKGKLSGNFHLGVIPTLASSVIPLFVESFAAKYPDVNLTIGEYKTEDMIFELLSDRIDAGIVVTPLHEPGIAESVLFREPFFVFCAREHALAKKKQVRDSDIDGSSAWLLEEGHCFRDQVIRVCSLKDRNEVLDNVHFASGNLETLINLVRRGRGFTLLPFLSTVHLSASDKKTHLREFVQPVPTREVSMVFSRDVLKRDIIDSLIAEIKANIPATLRELQSKKSSVIEIG